MKLVQVRPCDGQCCKDKPQYPTADGTDCIHRTGGRLDLACALIDESTRLGRIGDCPTHPDKDPVDALNEQCILWPGDILTTFPDNELSFYQEKCGNCCLQYVEDSDPLPAYDITIPVKTKAKPKPKGS